MENSFEKREMPIECEEVAKDNLDLAIKIQRVIFPEEDGALNLRASVDESLIEKVYGEGAREKVTFWLCKDKEGDAVGITGIYVYFEYPDDAWLAWYGILPEKRGQGYGSKLLLWTMKKAKELGYKNLRLYTDLEDNGAAVELYRKMGMIEESYEAEDMGEEKTIIFSKSLVSDKSEKLGNKMLFLKKQAEIQMRGKELD
ncbi:MAG: Uncharacterized protein Athens071425_565 [Parcubacteria group bacterium Athens0714_25]|nr:MAG: Uncharacterized protein Athens071425_565 [Parcubacteria group bacterium Athens0714_25]